MKTKTAETTGIQHSAALTAAQRAALRGLGLSFDERGGDAKFSTARRPNGPRTGFITYVACANAADERAARAIVTAQ